jgi:hypothetical protein
MNISYTHTHTHLLFDELLNYPVPQDKICHHRCWLTEYIFTINTTTYWFITNVNYVATCFNQSFVIFRPVHDVKIKLQLQIHFMVRLRPQSFVYDTC